MSVIRVVDLSFSYGKDTILNDVNICIPEGKLTCILGKNGGGKSTFLRLLSGMLPCPKGSVFINEHDNSLLSYSERAKIVGFLNQSHKAIFPFSVLDVVLTGRASLTGFSPKKEDANAACNALDKIGIAKLKDRCYTELSGGEQQLVMIARVLAQNPKILLLDEPNSHLDFTNQTHLMAVLKDLTKNGLTVITVLHDPNLAFIFGDDFLFVKDKQVIRASEKMNAWDAEFLKSVFDCNMGTVAYNGRALLVPEIN